MNPDFEYREFHYKKEDVATLKAILKCNRNCISAALSISIDELFLSIPEQHRAIFIVERCEDILAGIPEPESENMKQFEFRRSFRK